jgi:hypothetical protein
MSLLLADFVAEGGDYEQSSTCDDLVAMTCGPLIGAA